ncbi:hypothetical protein MAUB1S_11586 [Mycolicibacterium aubagnense]
MGRPNCSRIFGVLGGGVGGPPRDPDAFGGQQRGDEGAGMGLGQAGQDPLGTDGDGVGAHVRHRMQGVDALHRVDLQRRGIERHPLAADGHDQESGLGGGGHRTNLTADDESVALGFGGQIRGQGVCRDGLTGGQARQQAGLGVVRGDQGAGDGRRDERPGDRAVSELGQGDRELEDAEALSANGFRQVQARQALVGRRAPVGRWVTDRGLESFVQHLGGRDPRHQGSDRIGQIVVLGHDRDGHRCLL